MTLKKIRVYLTGLLLFASITTNASHIQNVNKDTIEFNNEKIASFIAQMVTKHKFDQKKLQLLFKEAQFQTSIIKSITTAHEALPWYRYQKIFLTPARVKAGVKFYHDNEETLKKAEQVYGIDPTMIVSIIGIETFFGKRTGNYRVLDALATLAFGYPPRAKFFKSELENFLLLTKEEKMNPLDVKGSYAGAMGIPQFMPSSYRHYARDFSNDGSRNLLSNTEDAIGSVANYFREHGWKHNAPIAFHLDNIPTSANKYLSKKTKPKSTVKQLKNAQINFPIEIKDNQKAAVIALENEQQKDYWIGLNNFYVITRYNVSINYAMVAYKLSEAIKEALQN